MHIIAHRGASKAAPENTQASFKLAKEMGASFVEFDVQLSKDNVAVVIHDETVDRTTNGSGIVCEKTFAQLALLDAGSWFDPAFSNETISSLDEILTLCSDIDLGVQIELKTLADDKKYDLVQNTIQSLKNHWHGSNMPIISSFCFDTLKLFKELDPSYRLGALTVECTNEAIAKAKSLGCYSIHVLETHLTQNLVLQLHQDFEAVFAWTVNDLTRAKTLHSFNIDAIFTDIPNIIQLNELR